MPRIPITLGPQDRARLEVLATSRDISLSEAVRRAIVAEYERIQEEETRERMVEPIQAMLERLAARVEAGITLTRSAEIDIKAQISELTPLLTGTSLRLLALVRCSRGRAEVEAEMERLVRSV